MDEKQTKEKWTRITRGNKITKTIAPYYVHLSNAYAKLAEFSAEPGPTPPEDNTKQTEPKTTIETNNQNKHQSKFKIKAARRRKSKFTKYMANMKDEGIINLYITKAEYERTTIAKQ